MCGIVGFIGREQAAPILLDGLARLEYRGYDSAGVAVYSEKNHALTVRKAKGRLQVLDELTHGGADVVIECVGNTAATRSAFEAAGFGATVLLFSVPAPTATVPLPLFDVYKKELAIRGSFINPDTHLRAVELLSAGRINVEPLITHTFGIGEMEQAIKMQGFRPDTVQGEPAYGINGQ